MTKANDRLTLGPVPIGGQGLALILEPDRPIRALVTEWLAMAQYGSVHVHDVAGAAKVAAQCDVVLLDIPATLRSARETIVGLAAVVPNTPIIAMSADVLASGPSAAKAVARELGVAAVLVKPFGREALMQAIERARTRT
jgi:DNA-binding response OmpR family regulator